MLGLRDRASALGGELRVESPPGEGTVVAAVLPIHSPLQAA
jgi:signal transduction histidine kinase